MLIIDSNGGCDVLVHHFETVEGFTFNCSANHLLVFFFIKITLNLQNSLK